MHFQSNLIFGTEGGALRCGCMGAFIVSNKHTIVYLSICLNWRILGLFLFSLSLRPMLERKSRDRELRVIFPGVTGLHVHFSEQVPFRGNTSIKRQTLRTCSTR